MIEHVRQILTGQFEAALCMLHATVKQASSEHWEAPVANLSLRQVAYHTLFFTDYYLSPSEDAFVLRELHQRGGDERQPVVSPGLPQDETQAYLALCRQKALATFAAETEQSLQGPSGFARKQFSRGELHLYNLRHIQHHAGQLSAALRRLDPALHSRDALPWVGSGWRD